MRKASTALLEPGTQTSPAPDLIPAENERQNLTGNSHSDWYNKRGHVTYPHTIDQFATQPSCALLTHNVITRNLQGPPGVWQTRCFSNKR
jgi:hypothetical protein